MTEEKKYQIVRTATKEGDIVLDPFMGSGTTAVACTKLGRNFIGFEIEPKYVEMANKRIAQHKGQKRLNLLDYEPEEGERGVFECAFKKKQLTLSEEAKS